ncbi:MAG: hemolysin family protein [Gemmatimonadota bacterium]
MTGILIALVTVLLLASAILSAAESAVFTIGASRVRTLLDEGFRGAGRLNEARQESPTIRSAIFFLDSVFNLTAAGLLVGTAATELGLAALWWAIPATTLGVLLVTEGVPRLVATRQSIRLALLSAPVLLLLDRLVSPILAPFFRLDDLIQRRNGEDETSPDQRELRELTALGRREGVVEEEEHLLVERAFRMDELSAWDIMTPRVDVFAWSDALTLDEIMPQLRNVPYSRVPVYRDSIDDITGILYVREAYEAYVGGHGGLALSNLSRDPFFVPGSLALPQLLRDFQARRLHMGIVADEFGGTDGLVTLEDVIEELVGEIEDETDIAQESILRISRNEMEVEGAVELREVNHAFNVSLPYLEHRSLNGFVLEELGRVPEEGEKIETSVGLEIEVLKANDTQVLRARLTKTHPAPIEEN